MHPRRPPPLSLLDALAERHIAEARARGELEGLPGEGAPLALEDDALVPEELRAAYRLLKNAGCLPPELQHCNELKDVETLLRHAGSDDERRDLLARLHWLLERSGAARRGRHLQIDEDYSRRIAERLAASRAGKDGA